MSVRLRRHLRSPKGFSVRAPQLLSEQSLRGLLLKNFEGKRGGSKRPSRKALRHWPILQIGVRHELRSNQRMPCEFSDGLAGFKLQHFERHDGAGRAGRSPVCVSSQKDAFIK